MMSEADGAARVAGALSGPLVVGDRTYTLSAPSVGKLIVEMQTYMATLRSNPLAEAVEAVRRLPAGLTPEERASFADHIWRTARDVLREISAPTPEEVLRFENSLMGLAFILWKCLEEHHGDEFTSIEDALELIRKMEEAMTPEEREAVRVALGMQLDHVTGKAEAGNSSGPTPSQGRATPSGPSGEDGPPSSNTSPTDSATPPTTSGA
jgi:hypothetical protein